jgi:GntR family transcriptional regulator, arabinose operon transcriptional repressor
MKKEVNLSAAVENEKTASMNKQLEFMKINRNAPMPLYQQILNEIRTRIASGAWPADTQLPTETDLELMLQISRVTIRQALSAAVEEGLIVRRAGKGTFVSGNKLSPSLVKTDGFIGYIVPHLSSSFNVQILLGVESILRDAGFHLIFCNSEGDLKKEDQLIQNLQNDNMAGYIIQPVFAEAEERVLYKLMLSGTRVVFIDRDIPGMKADVVMSNHFEGSRQVTRHLIDQGYKKIVYLAHEPIHLPSIDERLQGYQAAMSDFNLKPLSPFIVGNQIELGYDQNQNGSTPHEDAEVENISNFIAGKQRPEAIVAMNDLVAMLVLEAVRKCGLRIPEDLAVVGFDNLDCADAKELTTIAQRPFEIGSEAARLLLQRIRGNNEPARRILLPTQLIIRASSINPRQQ